MRTCAPEYGADADHPEFQPRSRIVTLDYTNWATRCLSGPARIRLLFIRSQGWPLWGGRPARQSPWGLTHVGRGLGSTRRMQGDTPDALFVRGAEQNKAKQVCAGCPVRTECLAEALDNQIEWGVWGGMTERERRALLRRRPTARRGAPSSRPPAPRSSARLSLRVEPWLARPRRSRAGRRGRGRRSPSRARHAVGTSGGRQRSARAGLLALDDADPVGMEPEQAGGQ